MIGRRVLGTITSITYSASLGYLVAGLCWQTFAGWLPARPVMAVGGILGIRVATLFASMTAAAALNWKAIWIGGGAGVAALMLWWPSIDSLRAGPPQTLLLPIAIAALVVSATAGTMTSPPTDHFYHSSRFARLMHSLQGLLFAFAIAASLVWDWTRPYVVSVTLSAFVLWKVWGGACPVTLVENTARTREGLAIMPPDSGFIPDALARLGVAVSGTAVTKFLYGLGFSLCGWFGISWLL